MTNNISIEVFIDNVKVDTKNLKAIKIKKQLKDIKEFSKRKTTFSKPISILQNKNNHSLFKNAFNINEVNGWDKNSRPLVRIVENNEVILEGICKLDKITKDSYNLVAYKEETNLDTIFGDELIRGNKTSSDDVNYINPYTFSLTRDNMRDYMNGTSSTHSVRTDGKGLNFGYINYGSINFPYGVRTDYPNYPMIPALAVKELLEEVFRTKGKTISFGTDISEQLDHMYIPYNEEISKELASNWDYYRGNYGFLYNTTPDKSPLGASISYTNFTNAKDAHGTDVERDSILLTDPGTYKITWHCRVHRSIDGAPTYYPYIERAEGVTTGRPNYGDAGTTYQGPKANPKMSLWIPPNKQHGLVKEDIELKVLDNPDEDIIFDLPTTGVYGKVYVMEVTVPYGGAKLFSGFDRSILNWETMDSDGDKRSELSEDDELFMDSTNYVELDKLDEFYNDEFPIAVSSNMVLPYNLKKKDLFNSIVTLFNAYTKTDGNNIHLDSFKDFNDDIDVNTYDWSDKLDEDSVSLSTLLSIKNESISYKYEPSEDLYSEDFKEQYDTGIYDRNIDVLKGQTKVEKNLKISSTPIDFNTEAALLANKDGKFSTKFKPRFLFVQNKEYSATFGSDALGGVAITHRPIFTTRKLESVYDSLNMLMGFSNGTIYEPRPSSVVERLETGNNFYTKFHEVEEAIYSNPDYMLLKGRFNLNSKDFSNITFNDLIYINSKKHGAAYYKLNSIDYNIDKLSNVELIQVTPLELTTSINNGPVDVDTVQLTVAAENTAISQSISGVASGTESSSVSGISEARVNALLADKLDKDATAVDSDKLDGLDSTQFARLDIENIFTENQTINANLQINGDIIQNGSSYETHAENIYSKNDYVTLRDGAISALESNELSGFKTKIPDGTVDTIFGVDYTGLVKIGKVGGLLQTVATRDNNIVDGNGIIWNALEKTFKDAGYKWAFKNGDYAQRFDGSVITAFENLQVSKNGLYGVLREDKIYSSAGGVDHRDLGLNFDRTILANDDGTLESKGLHSANFISGIGGTGTFNFEADSECDNLNIREKFKVNTFVNNKINIQNGDMVISDSATILTAVDTGSYWKITSAEDLPFLDNQILRFQNLVGTTMRYYKATVNNISWYQNQGRNKEMEIIITDGTDTPQAGDLLVRFSGGLLNLVSSDEVHGAYLDVLKDGVTKARFGNLTGINDVDFGQLLGDGAYIENLYGKGDIILGNGSSIDFSNILNTPNIVGINLALDSNKIINSTGYLAKTYNISEPWIIGQEYTITIKGNPTPGNIYGLWLNGGNSGGWHCTEISTGLWQTSFTPYPNTYSQDFSIFNYPSSGAGTYSIEWVKLEKGSTGTDWSPAPQDVEGRLTHIDANGIYSGQAVLGGFDIDANMVRSQGGGLINPDGRPGHISISNITTAYTGGLFDTGGRTLQGFSIGSNSDHTAYNLVMGQMMSNRSSIRTDYFGIQMMDEVSREYFALGFNTKTGASYNRIADWKFDSNTLWTGSSAQDSNGYLTDPNGILFTGGDMRTHKTKIVDGVAYFKDGVWTGGTIEGVSLVATQIRPQDSSAFINDFNVSGCNITSSDFRTDISSGHESLNISADNNELSLANSSGSKAGRFFFLGGKANITLDGVLYANTVRADNGWSGTYATGDGRTVHVSSGIITSVG